MIYYTCLLQQAVFVGLTAQSRGSPQCSAVQHFAIE